MCVNKVLCKVPFAALQFGQLKDFMYHVALLVHFLQNQTVIGSLRIRIYAFDVAQCFDQCFNRCDGRFQCVGDTFSTGVWNELVWLYNDLADAQFPKLTWNPIELTEEEQNAKLQELLAMESDLGFYWGAFEGGNHMATWIYGHGVTDAYDWLFTQTRESEMAREKLDLNKPFEAADEQIQTPEREVKKDSGIYFVTGKLGAGTADYNTTTYGKGGKLETYPNWKPAE